MNIRDYYINIFRQDLAIFMPQTPPFYFGHSWEYNCHNLDKISKENQAAFLVCLYFTVLVDQAMHAHFVEHYDKF
jgi:hypothetical protein